MKTETITGQRTPEQIMDYMNRYLPEDIAVIEIRKAGERFHSRLNVKGKPTVTGF